MNEKILDKYIAHLRGKYRKKMTAKNYHYFTKRCLQWINKPLEKMTKGDMMRWREYIINKYMPNGNFRRVSSVNHFLTWAGRKDLKIPAPKQEMSNKIIMSEKELENYLKASKDDPLWHMVALLQIDGIEDFEKPSLWKSLYSPYLYLMYKE
jgi:site-specific recombinase XerD